MIIRYADENDIKILGEYDKHISEAQLRECVSLNRVLVMLQNGVLFGWLRFGLFWDEIPFMNMLYLLSEYRGKGYGKELVFHWENEMRENNYTRVLTSTLSNEDAQFFYRSIGYTDCGALLLPHEATEIILMKDL